MHYQAQVVALDLLSIVDAYFLGCVVGEETSVAIVNTVTV